MIDVRLKSWMMAITFLICLFPFVSAREAAAQTSNSALSSPWVQSDPRDASGNKAGVQIGAIQISEGSYIGTIGAWDSISISLPTYCELTELKILAASSLMGNKAITLTDFKQTARTYQDENSNTYRYGGVACFVYKSVAGSSQGAPLIPGDPGTTDPGFYVQVNDNNRFTIGVTRATDPTVSGAYYKFLITPTVYVRPMGPNDPTALTATLDTFRGSGFSTASLTLGTVAVAGTTASVDAPLSSGTSQHYIVPVISDDGGSVAPIIIKENVSGSLTTSGTVTLTLPPGFKWNNADITRDVIMDWGFAASDVTPGIITDSGGRSAIKLTINKISTRPGRITVNGSVAVDSGTALSGDILVDYGGTNPGVSPAALTVAKYGTSGTDSSQETTADITAGRSDQKIGQFSIQEKIPGDLIPGRTITLTLPDGAKWKTAPTVARQSGDGTIELANPASPFNSDGRKVNYRVAATSTAASYYIFKNGIVDLSLENPDTLDITIGGSSGLTGTVTVANIMQPLGLAAEKTSVKLGALDQEIGDITITEQVAGALRARDASGNRVALTLRLPSGVTFSQMPELAVSDGNISLAISQAGLDSGGALLTIPVNQSSSVPSTITVSGILLTLDRSLPDGDIKLRIGGAAIAQTADTFTNDRNEVDLVIASTGAAGEAGATAVFIVDQASYTLNGQSVAMDVAPYIKNDRTMIPLRFAANALGIDDDNILWDDGTKTVTVIKGSRVVRMQLDKNELQINGVTVAIDAAPEIFSSRTMLPIRALGTALGATLQWDEAGRSVTINFS